MRVKYPRTPHLPWSPGASPDDVHQGDLGAFEGAEVVVTEKLDGENTTLYRDGLHARSLDGAHHPSRSWVKQLQGRIGPSIPTGWRLCGENLYARHALAYQGLAGYFYLFSVWTEHQRALGWDDTVAWAAALELPTPRVLFRGPWDRAAIRHIAVDHARMEGYVVRTVAGFTQDAFATHVGKYVRADHVQTDRHWMHQPVVPNELAPLELSFESRWPVLHDLAEGRGAAAACRRALAEHLALPLPSGAALEAPALGGLTPRRRLALALASLLREAGSSAALPLLEAGLPAALWWQALALADHAGAPASPVDDAVRARRDRRLARLVDLDLLHRLAGACADDELARERVELSRLFCEEAGLLREPDPYGPWRAALARPLASLDEESATRLFGEAIRDHEEGRARAAEEALPRSHRLRTPFARLYVLCGPSGSGKSTWAERRLPDCRRVSLDALREQIGGRRGDRRHEGEVVQAGLAALRQGLAAGESLVWDATSLRHAQRRRVVQLGLDYQALVTLVLFCVPVPALLERNRARRHAIPEGVLRRQLASFELPRSDEAHRLWLVDDAGEIVLRRGDAYAPTGGGHA